MEVGKTCKHTSANSVQCSEYFQPSLSILKEGKLVSRDWNVYFVNVPQFEMRVGSNDMILDKICDLTLQKRFNTCGKELKNILT